MSLTTMNGSDGWTSRLRKRNVNGQQKHMRMASLLGKSMRALQTRGTGSVSKKSSRSAVKHQERLGKRKNPPFSSRKFPAHGSQRLRPVIAETIPFLYSVLNHSSSIGPRHTRPLMTHLNHHNVLKPEELKIGEGIKSHRLDQETLERYWIQNSQEAPLKIPFWANADHVVQQIIHQDARPEIPISPSPTVRTPSLLFEAHVSGSSSLEDITMSSTNTSVESEPKEQAFGNDEDPLLETFQSRYTNSRTKRNRSNNKPEKPSKPHPIASTTVSGWGMDRSSRITKRALRPATGLRSRKITKFCQLS
ncbi:MAG: hypothetical protein Q9213_000696 [Squamulea squamosa]